MPAGSKARTRPVQPLITRLGLTQAEAAKQIQIGERTMRRYCAAERPPRFIVLALERLVSLHEAGR